MKDVFGEYQKVSLDNNTYDKILKSIPSDALVVYVSSLFNLNLHYLDKFKNVIIVLTKRDILPKSIIDDKIKNYVSAITNNYLDIEVISSVKNYNLDSLMNKIKKHLQKSKDVYFVGMTSSGKSTLINKIIKNYSDNNYQVTTSLYPSTTLDKIEIDIGAFKIIDTPGFLNTSSIINNIGIKDIKKITPNKEIKPRSYQLKGEGSLIIDNYLRLDYHTDNNIVIYLANNLHITKASLANNTFKEDDKHNLKIEKNSDVVIEDLCFIKFTKKCQVEIYTPYKISIYTRHNLI